MRKFSKTGSDIKRLVRFTTTREGKATFKYKFRVEFIPTAPPIDVSSSRVTILQNARSWYRECVKAIPAAEVKRMKLDAGDLAEAVVIAEDLLKNQTIPQTLEMHCESTLLLYLILTKMEPLHHHIGLSKWRSCFACGVVFSAYYRYTMKHPQLALDPIHLRDDVKLQVTATQVPPIFFRTSSTSPLLQFAQAEYLERMKEDTGYQCIAALTHHRSHPSRQNGMNKKRK